MKNISCIELDFITTPLSGEEVVVCNNPPPPPFKLDLIILARQRRRV